MYGWRSKIGLIIPSNNTVLEPELWGIIPNGVSVHASRILVAREATPEAIEQMESHSMRAAEELAAGGVDVIVYACMGTSLVKGKKWSKKFINNIERSSGIVVTTAATSTIDALNFLKVKSLSVATPYPEKINSIVPEFFKEHGFDVISIKNLNVADGLKVCKFSIEEVYKLAREADDPKAQAITILATDLPSIEVLSTIEKDLGKPVVSTNQAILWKALKLSNVKESINGYGMLLQ